MACETIERGEKKTYGHVFNIQRFSLHDGPGIRSTVFLKGCPLSCEWCSNPEGIAAEPELMASDRECRVCLKCVEICPVNAISVREGRRIIDRNTCNLCFECVEACPYGALSKIGKLYSVSELLREIERDRIFFTNSGGGVTFSGGEPLFQAGFTKRVFRECRRKQIHTTLDTTGYCLWVKMREVLDVTDLVLFDIKHIDPMYHRKSTGMDNRLILENFKKTSQLVATWVRIPLVPGFNDSKEHLWEILAYIYKTVNTKIKRISILPYHTWGMHKYSKIGKSYLLGEEQDSFQYSIEELKSEWDSEGIDITIGI
jgi:pyruvate formate lyase activating enzyme